MPESASLPRKQHKIISLLSLLLPLVALNAAGVASFLWFKAHRSAESAVEMEAPRERSEVKPVKPAEPAAFSEGLPEKLGVLLRDYGVGEKGIRKAKPDSTTVGVRNVYRVAIPSSTSLTLLHLKIRDLAERNGGAVMSGVESADGRTLALTLGAGTVPTDRILLQKTPGLETNQVIMAVIVDDLGVRSLENARRFCLLGQTVTLSVLPFQKHTREVVELAVETGTPYLLHMPMEPKAASEKPGEGAILAADSNEAIERKLALAFDSVSGAPGMNNHMGSRATEDIRVMETTLSYLRDNGLFFVDSRTSLTSVAYTVAQRIRVKCAVMTGYLDVIDERESIRRQLRTLAAAAFEQGEVIVICHDRPNTIEVLEQELPRLVEKGIRFVPAASLAK